MMVLLFITDKRFSYCFSSQTIKEAIKLVTDRQDQLCSKYNYLIVNIGAIDILLERELIDIEAEFANLIQIIFNVGLQPIVTTIPHVIVKNNPNEKIIRQTQLLFNNFLMNTYGYGTYHFIDLYASLFKGKKEDWITKCYEYVLNSYYQVDIINQ